MVPLCSKADTFFLIDRTVTEVNCNAGGRAEAMHLTPDIRGKDCAVEVDNLSCLRACNARVGFNPFNAFKNSIHRTRAFAVRPDPPPKPV